MGFLDRIINKAVEKAIKEKGLNPVGTNNLPIQLGNLSLEYDQKDYISAYSSNSDVYAIVSFLARKAASIPWAVYTIKGGQKSKISLNRYKMLSKGLGHPGAFERALIERKNALDEAQVEDGPLAELIKRPNQSQSSDQFFEQLFGYRFLSGEGNIWGNDGNIDNGEFVEMQILPTQFLGIITDPSDLYGINGYKLLVGNGLTLRKENVCAWKSWNPNFDQYTREHLRGVSPIKAAWNLYLSSSYAQQQQAAMMKNGGAKGALVPKAATGQPIPNITPEQASKIQQAINDRINNTDKAGSVALLQSSWDYLQFGMSAHDLMMVDSMKYNLNQWCRVFGLPTVLFDSDHTADNNYQNALRDLITNTIVPMCCQLRDELNKWLIPRMKANGMFLDFDIQALPELQKDISQLVAGLSQAQWLTMDEKRIAMNYEPKGGEFDMAYVNSGIVPLGQAGMDLSVPDQNTQDNLNKYSDYPM
jgi:HK97 family phage portal protein